MPEEYVSHGFMRIEDRPVRIGNRTVQLAPRYVMELLDGMLGEHFNLSLHISEEAYKSLGDGELAIIRDSMIRTRNTIEEFIDVEGLEMMKEDETSARYAQTGKER